jgi:hypothetical protein
MQRSLTAQLYQAAWASAALAYYSAYLDTIIGVVLYFNRFVSWEIQFALQGYTIVWACPARFHAGASVLYQANRHLDVGLHAIRGFGLLMSLHAP